MDIKLESVKGEVLTHIDVDESSDRIMLTTASGKTILIHHDQECCESVRIEDTQGNWHDLIGKVIVEATHDVCNENPPPNADDAWARTTLTFRTDDSTVISRWIGESNGYYSIDVNIADITGRA